MFPPYEARWFNRVVAELCYSQHGGSGLSFTPADVERLDLDEIEFYLDWLDERRSDEAERIKKASR